MFERVTQLFGRIRPQPPQRRRRRTAAERLEAETARATIDLLAKNPDLARRAALRRLGFRETAPGQYEPIQYEPIQPPAAPPVPVPLPLPPVAPRRRRQPITESEIAKAYAAARRLAGRPPA